MPPYSARQRKYVVSVTAIVFTAGIQSVSLWWQQLSNPEVTEAAASLCRMKCAFVCLVLTVGSVIIFEIVRRCVIVLANGVVKAEAEIT